MTPLAIVTASTDLERARPCIESWIQHRADPDPLPLFVILNGCPPPKPRQVEILGQPVAWLATPQYLGSVPAFRKGVEAALHGSYRVIACLHDDFEIAEDGWDRKVLKYFDRNPSLGLAGFGGAIGLGALDMYEKAYDPMSLARIGFRSDLDDAESHGLRSVLAERVACLDGFSQIGRRDFWAGQWTREKVAAHPRGATRPAQPPWQQLEDLGFLHHFYDGALGCLAARNGWETWYIPVRGHHYGGRTAVGDPGYQEWAKTVDPKGDQGFWSAAHLIGYEEFRDVLPLRV